MLLNQQPKIKEALTPDQTLASKADCLERLVAERDQDHQRQELQARQLQTASEAKRLWALHQYHKQKEARKNKAFMRLLLIGAASFGLSFLLTRARKRKGKRYEYEGDGRADASGGESSSTGAAKGPRRKRRKR